MKRQALLAIDTSTEICSVAICFPLSPDPAAAALGVVTGAANAVTGFGGEVAKEIPVDLARRISIHDDPLAGLRFLVLEVLTGSVSSTFLLPAVDAVLAAANVKLSDCVALAFGAGPGSFTGLRTATGTAQGLAFGAGLRVVPVNTLMACAESTRMSGAASGYERVLIACDARMAECYWQAFEWAGPKQGWLAVTDAKVGAADTVQAPWHDIPGMPYLVAGNAVSVFGDTLACLKDAQARDVDARPGAAAIAAIAWRAWQAGETMAPAQALPQYVRDKVASTTREREIEKAQRAQQLK